LKLGTHFTLSMKDQWVALAGDRDVMVEKIRPLFFAGLRPQTYRMLVDGELVAERRGY
jgi:hypothetical protein